MEHTGRVVDFERTARLSRVRMEFPISVWDNTRANYSPRSFSDAQWSSALIS